MLRLHMMIYNDDEYIIDFDDNEYNLITTFVSML